MFKVDPSRTFTRTITVITPEGDGVVTETFKVTFNYLSTDETKEFDLSTAGGTTEFLRKAVARMDDLTDVRNNPLPYTDAVRDSVFVMPLARRAITREYFATLDKAAEGN